MKILVFGNPHLPGDSLALTIANKISLPDVSFQHSENLNDLLELDYDAILDVAYGIPKVVKLDDMSKLREHRLFSLHDYDVAFFLKLMAAMGKLDKIKIFAVPVDYAEEKALDELRALIEKNINTR